MNGIEEIWNQGSHQLSHDKSIDAAYIEKTITERSNSITAQLPKIIWFGIVMCGLAALVFIYNVFFFLNNPAVLVAILILLLATMGIIIFLLQQVSSIQKMGAFTMDLHALLVLKIKYFTTRFQVALHCVALSLVLATFSLNLTMENEDGIIELRKVLILGAFYLVVYFISVYIYQLTHRVYLKQLKNALANLEENSLTSLDQEMKRHLKIRNILLLIALIVFIGGLVALYIVSVNTL